MSQIGEVIRRVQSDLRNMWDRRWIGVATAWGAGLVAAAVVAAMPNRFEATTKVFVDTQTVLKPLMAGLAFQPDVDQQVRMLARTLISSPNMEQLLKSPAVGLEQPPANEYERAIESLKKKIKFEPAGPGIFTISYRDQDPQRARRVVDSLLRLFMDSGTSVKQRDSFEASKFIDQQIKDYEGKLTESENRLKDFKLRNINVVGSGGGAGQDYFARTNALAEVVNRLRLDLSAAEQSRDALRKELSSEDPQLPPESMPVVQAPSEIDSRIDAQRRQLDDLLRRYTDEHPDVVAVRRTLAQLEARKRAEAEAKARGAKQSGSAATNPVYQRLRVSLAEAEANVASLRTQLGIQQGRLDQARALANRVPQVEAELAQLNRDYDVIRRNYEALVSRREAASLGVKIDQTNSMAEFRIVEPPAVSDRAVFPSRGLLAALVLPFAVAVGAGVAFALTRMVSTVEDERSLRELIKRPVLGTLSMVMNPARRAQSRKESLAFGLAVAAFVCVNVGWMAWILMSSRVA